MGHLTLESMSRLCDLKGNVKDYFMKDGMGKLLAKRVKCRQLIPTMASLLRFYVLHWRGTLGDQGYRRESSDPESILTLTPIKSGVVSRQRIEDLRVKVSIRFRLLNGTIRVDHCFHRF